MKPMVYLCGPINGCTDEEATTWRKAFKSVYPGPCLDPMRRDYRGTEQLDYREIVELDKCDIRTSDVLLVNYVRPSVGTSMEIFYAHELGKPVLLWCKTGGDLPPWLRYHSTALVHSLNGANEWVQKVYVRSAFT